MDRPRLGIVHPGSMGVSVGAAASATAEVLWAGDGRSPATTKRADGAGFTDVGSLGALVEGSDAIISLVPPAAAETMARQIAAAGFDGIFVDANAIAPDRAETLASVFAHASFVDGGVIGPPAVTAGTTRLYLSGPDAHVVSAWFSGSIVEALAIGPEIGSASALKMAYAAYTKGSSALLMAVRALAEAHGLTDVLLAEWARSIPELNERSEDTLRRIPRKAWRFAGEMEEIAATFEAAALPGGFHLAAAELFRRVGPEADEADPDDVLRSLLDGISRSEQT